MNMLKILILLLVISSVFAISPEQLSHTGTRLLVLTAMGDEATDPSLVTAKAMLTAQGVPFDVVAIVPSKWAGKVSTANSIVGHNLEESDGQPIYTGIVLTSDQLAWQGSDGGWYSGLDWSEWVGLWTWEAKHGVRSVSLFTWPSSNYGVTNSGWGTSAPTEIVLTNEARQFIPSLPEGTTLPLTEWYYEAEVCTTCEGACACTVTPFAHYSNGKLAAAVRNVAWPGTRQELMFFMVQSKWYSYSTVLSNLWVNWITDMAFVGSRRVLLSAQIDDLLLSTEVWDPSTRSEGTVAERTTNTDLQFTKTMQEQVNTQLLPGSQFVVEMAFNGKGTMDRGGIKNIKDRLFKKCIALRDSFFWLTHTYSHLDMTTIKYQDPTECLGKAGLIGTPTTYEDNNCELGSNLPIADALFGVDCGSQFADNAIQSSAACKTWSADSIVSPHISGTHHEPALRSMQEHGIANMVGDNSKPWLFPFESQPGGWYWGIETDVQTHGRTGTFIIPRGATNIFYNVHTPIELVDMYNWIYEPQLGYSSLGKILEREGQRVGKDMLDLKPQPHMFHQVNLKTFKMDASNNHWEPYFNPIGGKSSLLSLWLDAVVKEFSKYSKYWVKTLKQSDLAKNVKERMQRDQCGANVKFVHVTQSSPAATHSSPPIAMEVSASSGPCSVGVTGKKGLPIVDNTGSLLPSLWRYEEYMPFEGTTWIDIDNTPITVPLDAPLSVLPVSVSEIEVSCLDITTCRQGYQGEVISVPLIIRHPLLSTAKRTVPGVEMIAFADIGGNSIEVEISGILDGNYQVIIPIDITTAYPNTDISLRILLVKDTINTPVSNSPVAVKILGARPASAAEEPVHVESFAHKTVPTLYADESQNEEDIPITTTTYKSVSAQIKTVQSHSDLLSLFTSVEISEAEKACQSLEHHKKIGEAGIETCIKAVLVLSDTRYAEVMPENENLPDAHEPYVLGEAIMAAEKEGVSGGSVGSFFGSTLGLTIVAISAFLAGSGLIFGIVILTKRRMAAGEPRKSVIIERGIAGDIAAKRVSDVNLPTRRVSTVPKE